MEEQQNAGSDGMRVVHVADAYPSASTPAANSFIHEQILQLRRLGVEVMVFCPTPYVPKAMRVFPKWGNFSNLPSRETLDGVQVLRPRFLRPPGRWFRAYAAQSISRFCSGAFDELCAGFQPDVIHAHMTLPVGLASVRMNADRRPLVLTVHGLDVTDYTHSSSVLRELAVESLCGSDAVLCVSEYLKEATTQLCGAGISAKSAYLGVNLEQFQRDDVARNRIRSAHGIGDDVLIGYVGRIEDEKGVFEALELVSRVRAAGTRAAGMFIGDGSRCAALKQKAGTLGLQDAVHLVPSVPNSEIPGYMSALDLLVLPSKQEGFGLVLIEAQACGTPVIATRTGGIVEAVEHGTGGFLVEPGDLAALTSHAVFLAKNSQQRAEMGARAAQWVHSRFDGQEQAVQLFRIYERLARQAGYGSGGRKVGCNAE